MTATNRALIAVIAALAAVAAFWLLALAPKRERADELGARVTALEASVSEQERAIAAGVEARRDFPAAYHQLVLLGKAVPAGDDAASFLVQLNEVADGAGIQFRQLMLDESSSVAPPALPTAPAPAQPSATEPVPEEGAAAPGTSVPAASTSALPTEAAAATLPIGATVGPAGLGILPYQLQFEGTFFEIADFLAGVDAFVETDRGHVAVDGRLVTVDGFSLSRDRKLGFPSLAANLVVTTFVTPSDQGLTAGATPTAPAPAGSPQATPVSTTPSP
jgi:Tfp pilus assembly protein PilO